MSPKQFRDRLYTSVKRGNPTEVRVGIRLEAILKIDEESRINEAIEIGKNDIVNGVYGGIKEELRGTINQLLEFSQPAVNGEQEYYQARQGLMELMKTL